MPIQAPQWTEFLSCPICCHDFDVAIRGPISLGCGHTVCRTCLANLRRKQCPFDQSSIKTEIERLPLNEALLQLVGNPVSENAETACQSLLSPEERADYLAAKRCVEELALYLKPCQATLATGTGTGAAVSRPMQRKLVGLVGCQLVEPEGRARAVRAARSLGERSVTELILRHQNPQQLSANLWAAVRARGCQFLGPAMQEEVLKLVLLALEDGSALSRKVLVMFVVQRLEPHFAQASKTSIGHVVQLLYRASCFKVSKREGDSSLMQLKEEFRSYEALRREHDAQIVQIATEAGLRIAPDQWSALLYGDTGHKSHMQSIIDKLQTPQSFAQSVQELVIALQRTPDPGQLSSLRPQLELLAAIDPSPDTETPSWLECRTALEAVRTVVAALVLYVQQQQQHGNRKCQEGVHTPAPGQPKYKVSMCRDLALRGSCPRATNCTFAHSEFELDKYRSKNRKLNARQSLSSSLSSSGSPESRLDKSVAVVSPCAKDISEQRDEPDRRDGKGREEDRREIFRATAKLEAPENRATIDGNDFGESLGNYPVPPVRTIPRGISPKNPEIQRPRYIMHGGAPFDLTGPNIRIWDASQIAAFGQNGLPNNGKKRSVAKTLAVLLQRRMEIMSQLESIVGKPPPQQLKMNYDVQGNRIPPPGYSIWTNASGIAPGSHGTRGNNCGVNNRRRSDSVLLDDEFVPFDAPPATTDYGPISRLSEPLARSNSGSQGAAIYNEGAATSHRTLGPPPASNPVTSWYYGHQQPCGTLSGNLAVQAVPNSIMGDAYVTLGRCNIADASPQARIALQECASKDLILESQRVREQLRHLEKKINDLKLATEGATLTEGERLAQELRMIEAGIREKERDVRNWSPYGSVPWIQQASNRETSNRGTSKDCKSEEEDTYEAGIANDMRELELRWDFELREQEKRWSNEEDGARK